MNIVKKHEIWYCLKTQTQGVYTMNLKSYLANIKMTIKDFSALMDVNPNYLSSIINGHAKAGNRLARDIEKATNGTVKVNGTNSDKKSQANPTGKDPETIL